MTFFRSRDCRSLSLVAAVFLFVSVFILMATARDAVAAEGRPNFIIFIADDMAWDDCGAYGHPHIRTPNVDRLAREGMRFDRAFLTCSSCSPSRSSIMTGRYPHSTGAEQLHWPLPADQVMFPKLLREGGYWTASAGKWHLGDDVVEQFDLVETRMNQWVATLKKRPRDKPFFLWAAFSDPHRPYQENTIPEPHGPGDAVVPPYLPDVPETRVDLALYYDEIARLDGVVGDVLEEVEAQGATDDTFVLFMSDNGRPFPRCKTTVYDSGIRTPWIVKFPGRVKPGSASPGLVSSVDIGPTVIELAGLPPSGTFQGVSFAPLLGNLKAGVRSYVFAEHNWHDYSAYERAARSPRIKYIRNSYPELPGTPPADAVRSITYQAMQRLRDADELPMVQRGPFLAPRPSEELYDVESDPHELVNLVDDPRYAATLGEMRDALDAWQRETGNRIPPERTPDGFDRETGAQLPGKSNRRAARTELRAGTDE